MTKLKKSICKLSKDEVEKSLEELVRIVSNPKYICQKCARVAKSKKQLCKPDKISDYL